MKVINDILNYVILLLLYVILFILIICNVVKYLSTDPFMYVRDIISKPPDKSPIKFHDVEEMRSRTEGFTKLPLLKSRRLLLVNRMEMLQGNISEYLAAGIAENSDTGIMSQLPGNIKNSRPMNSRKLLSAAMMTLLEANMTEHQDVNRTKPLVAMKPFNPNLPYAQRNIQMKSRVKRYRQHHREIGMRRVKGAQNAKNYINVADSTLTAVPSFVTKRNGQLARTSACTDCLEKSLE